MPTDFIEEAKKEINSFLKDDYGKKKFTVKFNGEFFIAAANGDLPEKIDTPGLDSVLAGRIKGNKIIFYLSGEWLKYALSNIEKTECSNTDLSLYSQAKRLEKQLDFELCGGKWNESMYWLALKILYFLHTKSLSIRRNIVKKCAQEYNILQRQGRVPRELVSGYRNALYQISDKI